MEVHRDLAVSGTPADLAAFIERVTECATGEWERDLSAEQRITERADDPFYCFGHVGEGGAATLVLAANREGALYVTNVVPVPPRREMSRAECNAVIEWFYHLAHPVAGETNVEITMTSAHRSIEENLSADAFQKLRAYSGIARESSAHPNDRRRWMDFVIQTHVEQAPLDAETLNRWLAEERGWDGRKAWDLAAKYQEERELLDRYDTLR